MQERIHWAKAGVGTYCLGLCSCTWLLLGTVHTCTSVTNNTRPGSSLTARTVLIKLVDILCCFQQLGFLSYLFWLFSLYHRSITEGSSLAQRLHVFSTSSLTGTCTYHNPTFHTTKLSGPTVTCKKTARESDWASDYVSPTQDPTSRAIVCAHGNGREAMPSSIVCMLWRTVYLCTSWSSFRFPVFLLLCTRTYAYLVPRWDWLFRIALAGILVGSACLVAPEKSHLLCIFYASNWRLLIPTPTSA